MADSERLEIALVGCGGIAGAHVRGLQALQEQGINKFVVTATCDILKEKANEAADKLASIQGVRPKVYDNMDKVLAHEKNLVGVDICTLHCEHHTLAVKAFEAGLNVTIEKPLGITMRAARRIMDAAEKAGRLLHVAENYRLSPEQRAVNHALRTGRIGKPRMVYWIDVGDRLFYWTWREHKMQAGAGWALDGGVHFADLFRYHFGDVATVSSVIRIFHPYRYRDARNLAGPIEVDVEDCSLSHLVFEAEPMIGQWTWTSAAPGEKFSQRVVYGDEGSIKWGDGLKTRSTYVHIDKLVSEYRDSLDEEESERLFPHGVTDTIGIELWQFQEALLGGPPVETDGLSGYKAMAISLAQFESHALCRPVATREVEALEVENYQAPVNEACGIV